MAEQHYKVEVQSDHLERLANARPIQALAELIWNGLDADATRVDVIIDSSDIGMHSITVRDNGHGIPHADAPKLFGKLGDSWKRHGSRSRKNARLLHGKEGKGRFKANALGRVSDWHVVYEENGSFRSYTITLIRDNLVDVRISEENDTANNSSGVSVTVSELHRDFRSLQDHEKAIQELSEIFALYMYEYRDVVINYQGNTLDPSSVIKQHRIIEMEPIADGDKSYPVSLDIIEWKSATERTLYLCDDKGFPFQRIQPGIQAPGFDFSVYLKSSYIAELQEKGLLDLAEMNPALQEAIEAAKITMRDYFRDRDAEKARTEIEEWKEQKVYPYQEEPQSEVERAERQVFDIIALNVNRHLPEFSSAPRKSKEFQLRMLRQAIERGPEDLQLILKEVLNLPERKQQELASLLKEASLSNVISASKLVSDRLKFIRALELLVFDGSLKKHLKERSQLHRFIAENNTWIFGEEFNLTVDDKSLTEVLRRHQKEIGKDVVIDRPVTRIDESVGIVDLMLSRAVPQNHADEREHLVVELKRPSVPIDVEEINQIKSYAFAIAEDDRFESIKTRWSFWVISSALGKNARRETRQSGRPRGMLYKSEDGIIEIWCKTWSEIIDECNARMRFIQNELNARMEAGAALKYLNSTYKKYIEGTAVEASVEQKIQEEA